MGNREETEPSERAEKQGRRKGTRKKVGERQKKKESNKRCSGLGLSLTLHPSPLNLGFGL
jgi:hypothetical protein